MNGDDYKVLDEKLKGFKEFQEEKWKSHNKESNNRWATIQTNIDSIPERVLAKLNCKVHKVSLGWHSWMLKSLWTVVIGYGLVRGELWIFK